MSADKTTHLVFQQLLPYQQSLQTWWVLKLKGGSVILLKAPPFLWHSSFFWITCPSISPLPSFPSPWNQPAHQQFLFICLHMAFLLTVSLLWPWKPLQSGNQKCISQILSALLGLSPSGFVSLSWSQESKHSTTSSPTDLHEVFLQLLWSTLVLLKPIRLVQHCPIELAMVMENFVSELSSMGPTSHMWPLSPFEIWLLLSENLFFTFLIN